MPNGVWGVDYSSLNDYTINAKTWNPKNFYNGVENLNTNTNYSEIGGISITVKLEYQ